MSDLFRKQSKKIQKKRKGGNLRSTAEIVAPNSSQTPLPLFEDAGSEITFEHENGFLSESERGAFYNKMQDVVVLVEYSSVNEGGVDNTNIGTGFPLQKRGLILTCFHPMVDVEKGDNFEICIRRRNSTRLYEAREVDRDVKNDLLLLKIVEEGDFKLEVNEIWGYVKFNISEIKIGSETVIISHSRSMYFTCCFGHVAAVRKVVDVEEKVTNDFNKNMDIIQINNVHGLNGMSGAPVFNSKGEVMGMVLFILHEYDFAVSAAYFQDFIIKHMK